MLENVFTFIHTEKFTNNTPLKDFVRIFGVRERASVAFPLPKLFFWNNSWIGISVIRTSALNGLRFPSEYSEKTIKHSALRKNIKFTFNVS